MSSTTKTTTTTPTTTTTMSWFTCLTCRVSLATGDDQRRHYKSDWHSYNLRRKLAQLPVVTSEQFDRIEEVHRNRGDGSSGGGGGGGGAADDNESTAKRSASSSSQLYCQCCGKQFSTDKAFGQHLNSKKHLQQQQQQQSSVNHNNNNKQSAIISLPDDDSDKKADDLIAAAAAVTAMSTTKAMDQTVVTANKHIDDVVVDDDDDDDEDWESVDSGDDDDDDDQTDGQPIRPNECLFCQHSSLTIEDNMSHMSFSHSFFIPDIEFVRDLVPFIEYLGEKVGYGHYCLWCCDSGKRFRSVRSAQQHMQDRGHTKLNHSTRYLPEYSQFYDYTKSYPDYDGSKQLVTIDDDDDEVVIPHIDDSDWQLALPSGAVIGHRSLFRYYRQNLKPITDTPANKSSSSAAILDKVMTKYRALGWTGSTGEASIQRARDVQFVQRIQRRHALKMGQKNNKILQKHFRNQILF
ncbi:cytoplasmic 60S subunit biogenesis factor ZNF622-like [Oppia nitens]|uniref:cytoplasmic 60S subunit biogenesis factor ZNF622-like n=1 Tax=Oppia nitens TaxID=1686743 RepID=UPI0023DA68D4|nr:cytoplasmic 60S subunit biogenesis factor ZNF622-like [Oppia nitens]